MSSRSAGEAAEPGVIRHRPVAQVVVQPAGGVGEGFLDDVRRVHAGGQPAVEPDGDHPPEPVPVAGEQLVAGGAVAGGGAVEQEIRVHGSQVPGHITQNFRERCKEIPHSVFIQPL